MRTRRLNTITPKHVYFVFIDGIGLTTPDPETNPFAQSELPGWRKFSGGYAWDSSAPSIMTEGHVFRPTDANLGVEGLPQSGTGQATLFSGVNCSKAAGRHYGPFPHSTSKPILRQNSIYARLVQKGFRTESLAFANAYPHRFFVHAWERKRWTVTTYMARMAGVTLRTADDLRQGRAISAGITNDRWRDQLDASMPMLSEIAAAQRFYSGGQSVAFTLFEYYLTDKIGHEQDAEKAKASLTTLDRFLNELHNLINPATDLLVLTSDHGNLEDLSTKTHTRNPVPLLAFGAGATSFGAAASLVDVTPTLVELMQES